MPSVSGLPLQRKTPVTKKFLINSVYVDINFSEEIDNSNISLGSDITKSPNRLFKTITVCPSRSVVVETVFSIEQDRFIFLYAKVIGIKTKVLISLNGINTFRQGNDSVKPLFLLVAESYWRKSKTDIRITSLSIVDPIFDLTSINYEVIQVLDQIETGGVTSEKYEILQMLYQEAPDILEAMIKGYFERSPFLEIPMYHPFPYPEEEKWSLHQTSNYVNNSRCGIIHFNQQEFDDLVYRLILLRPSKLTLTINLSHAIEGLLDLSVINHFHDYYSEVFPFGANTFNSIREDLKSIVTASVYTYCQIYDIDFNVFSENTSKSSLTLEKNIYDEVSFTFHDYINDRVVTFYSYFSLTSLGTFGAGSSDNYTRG